MNCPECNVAENELHKLLCSQERCPFCGLQFVSCGCMRHILDLSAVEKVAREARAGDNVVLPEKGVNERWVAALMERGRVPFSPG